VWNHEQACKIKEIQGRKLVIVGNESVEENSWCGIHIETDKEIAMQVEINRRKE
jgi:hypothetical protein